MAEHRDKKPYIWVNEFTEAAVKDFYEQFFELELEPDVPIIPVFIDSYGGEVNGLFAMRDLIKGSEKPVATICVSKAMSAAACLLAAGYKGLRFASPDAEIMIHELSSGTWGKNESIKTASRQLTKINRRLLKNLAEDMEISKKDLEDQIHKIKNTDWYLSPTEAKKWGIVDNVEIPRIMYRNPAALLVTLQKKKGT